MDSTGSMDGADNHIGSAGRNGSTGGIDNLDAVDNVGRASETDRAERTGRSRHMDDQKRALIGTVAGIAIVMAGIVLSFLRFYVSNVSRITKQNESYIADITSQRAQLIRDLFYENIRYIESSAIVMETEFLNRGLRAETLDVEAEADIAPESLQLISDILGIYEERFAFNYLRFIDRHGRDYTTEEGVIRAVVLEREYFQRGISGQTGMTYILDSKVTNERQIGFYSPVVLNGEIIGVVVGFYGEAFMDGLLSMSMFGYDCDMLLCARNGTVIYNTEGNGRNGGNGKNSENDGNGTEGREGGSGGENKKNGTEEENGKNVKAGKIENFFENSVNGYEVEEKDRDLLRRAFQEGGNALYSYVGPGGRSVGYVAYVGEESGFSLVMRFPMDAFRDMVASANMNGMQLLVLLSVLFAAVGVFYVVRFLLQKKRLVEESKNSNDIHAAVSNLFETFVLVDAETGRYRFIEGAPENGELPGEGDYGQFAAAVLSHLVTAGGRERERGRKGEREREEAERKEAGQLLELSRIVGAMNEGTDVISYNFHTPMDGKEWFTYNFIVIARQEGKVREFVIASQDITKLQEKEAEVKKLLEKARDDAEKGNQAKSNFLSNMSHEIRTPITAILGMNELIQRESDSESVLEYSDGIQNAGVSLLGIISDILDFSKIEAGRMEIIAVDYDLRSVLSDSLNLTRLRAEGKGITLSAEIDPDLPFRLRGDELRVKQILANLLSNAVKYTERGSVRLICRLAQEAGVDTPTEARANAETRTDAEAETRVGASGLPKILERSLGSAGDAENAEDMTRPGRMANAGRGAGTAAEQGQQRRGSVLLYFAVEDTGIGIRPEERDRLFTAFDRLDAKRNRSIEGTGLGLAITYKMLDLMGSRLQVESTYGQGSTFSFALRQEVNGKANEDVNGEAGAQERIGDFDPMQHTVDTRKRGRKRTPFVAPDAHIMVVDDTPMNLQVICGLLKRTDMRIDAAEGGAECVERFGADDYDLLFLDYRMPGMDGIETLLRIKELYPEKFQKTPILCLTASAVTGDREKMLAAGFTDYLTKPVNIEEMEKALMQYLPEDKVILVEGEEEDSETEEDGLEALPRSLFQIPLLDPEMGVQFCGGAEEYMDALEIFTGSIGSRAQKIAESLAEGDLHAYTIAVHSLKSTSRSVGAESLSELAKKLEKAGDEKQEELLRRETPTLLEMYRSLSAPLEAIFREKGQGEDEKREAGEKGEKRASGEIGEEETETRGQGQGEEDGESRLLSEAGFDETLLSMQELCMASDYENLRMMLDMLEQYEIPASRVAAYNDLRDMVDRENWDGLREYQVS